MKQKVKKIKTMKNKMPNFLFLIYKRKQTKQNNINLLLWLIKLAFCFAKRYLQHKKRTLNFAKQIIENIKINVN